jgi:acyl dehydratase
VALSLTGLGGVKAHAGGQELGVGDWHLLAQDQEELDAFATVTGEERFVDPDLERAKQTPFGGTIACGYCTRSLSRPSRRRARRSRP